MLGASSRVHWWGLALSIGSQGTRLVCVLSRWGYIPIVTMEGHVFLSRHPWCPPPSPQPPLPQLHPPPLVKQLLADGTDAGTVLGNAAVGYGVKLAACMHKL